MDSALCDNYNETLPLDNGNYLVIFYRNSYGACSKNDATEMILHFHNLNGDLVDCEYRKLN